MNKTPSRFWKAISSACVCAMLLGASQTAHAQQGKPISEWTTLDWALGLGMPITTTTFGSASTVIKMRENQLERQIERMHKYVWVRDHLESNEIGLRQDIAMGGGPILEDLLSQLYPDAPITAQTFTSIRSNHAQLRSILDEGDTIERAVLLCDTLDQLVGVTPADIIPEQTAIQGGVR